MDKQTHNLVLQGALLLSLLGNAFLLVDGQCKSDPPDPRGTRITIPETLSAVQHLQGNRTRITFEFEGRDAEVAEAIIRTRNQPKWLKIGEEAR